HQKQETTRVLTTDFGLVCHGFPPLFLASRELRLSRARGHRLESCRDHPQNAATPGVRRVTLVTGERATGRTRVEQSRYLAAEPRSSKRRTSHWTLAEGRTRP